MTSRISPRFRIEIDNKIITRHEDQYLDKETCEERGQAVSLNSTMWRNKQIGIEAKSRIAKKKQDLLMQNADTRPETTKT